MSISESILEKLRANDKSTTDLGISGSAVGNEGAKILAKALEGNTSLVSLELGNSNIGAEGVAALASILTKVSALKTLYLRGNKIGDGGAKALAAALKSNNCLEHLYLGGNEIGIEGVKAFAEAFERNSTLQTIYLRNNHVGDEGAKILADALQKNFGLRVLNVANAELTEVGCKDFIKLLDSNTTLQSIVFEHNGVEAEDIVKAFADRLKYNESLEVTTSNIVAKKILRHCEDHMELERIKEDKRPMTLEELAQNCALSRAEQYHWSGNNLQGNAILCVSFLSRMILGRYSYDQETINDMTRVARTVYEKLLARAKEDLANPKVIKPNQEILQAATLFIG